jgi:hypothetical protein
LRNQLLTVVHVYADVEKEVEFRNQMFVVLKTLMENEDPSIYEAAFSALLSFPGEDMEPLIPEPTELLRRGINSDFLIQKIQMECRDMSRPVFKGLSIEEGGKKATEATYDFSNRISSIEDRILQLWGQKPKQLGPAALFCLRSKDWKQDCDQLREISLQEQHCLDALEGYTYFWSRATKLQQSSTMAVDEMFGYIMAQLTKTNTPNTLMNLILSGTGLATACIGTNFSTKWTHQWLEYLKLKLDENMSRDVEGCVLLSLSKLIRTRKSFDSELWQMVWNRCIGPGYLHAISACILLTLVSHTEHYSKCIEEYMERWYSHEKWKSVGAAIGFAVLLKENLVYRDSVLVLATQMLNNAKRVLEGNGNNVEEMICASWLVSCLAPEDASEMIRDKLLDVIQKRHEDVLPHMMMAYIRSAPQTKYTEVKELINFCIEHSHSQHVAVKYAAIHGFQILIGNDLSFMQPLHIASSTDSLTLLELSTKIIATSEQSRFVRSTGFVIGNGLLRMQNRINGISNPMNLGDPIDYRRLNPEKSYLHACYDLLRNPGEEMDQLIIKNVFFNVDCILPPVDWSFLFESRTRDQVLELFQFVCKQVDDRSARCMISYFFELFHDLMSLYLNTKVEAYEPVLLGGLETLVSMVGLHGGTLISVQQCWDSLSLLLELALSIRWNDFGIRFTSLLKKSLQRSDESDIKHELCTRIIRFVQNLDESVSSNSLGLCIKNLTATLGTSTPEQDQLIQHLKSCERDLWAYSGILETREEHIHQFLLLYHQLIKLESKSAVYCLWYTCNQDTNILKWFVDILDMMIMTLNPDKIHYSKFLWNVGVSCLDPVTDPVHDCDWKCINFNTILRIKQELKKEPKSKRNQAILSRLSKLQQHFQNNQISREIRFLLGQ